MPKPTASSSKNTGIYVIENMANGDRYVGSAAKLKHRRTNHYENLRKQKHHNRHLQSAWNKYGKEAFRFRILFYCDRGNLIMFEQRAIDIMRPEYNMNSKTTNWLGLRHSEASRAKMSLSAKTNRALPGVREHLAETSRGNKNCVGRKLTLEQRAAMSVARKGRRLSVEAKAKVSTAQRGRKRSAETRARMSEAQRLRMSLLSQQEKSELIKKVWISRKANLRGRQLELLRL